MSQINQDPSQSNETQQLDAGYYKVDHRYRESNYFLADQLRYAEAVQDFRSVKQALTRSTQFSLANVAFRFARAIMPEKG